MKKGMLSVEAAIDHGEENHDYITFEYSVLTARF